MNQKEKTERFFFHSRWDMILLLIFFLGLAMKMNYLLANVTGNHRLYVNLFRTGNLALLVFGVAGLVLSLRFGRFLLAFLSFVLSLFFFTFVFYFRYFGTIASWADLDRAGNLAPVIHSLTKQIARPGDILFLLGGIVILILGIAGLVRKHRPRRLRLLVYISCIILSLLLQFFQSIAFNIRSRQSFAHVKRVGNSSFINCHGFLYYTIYDIYHHYKILGQSRGIAIHKPSLPESLNETGYPISPVYPGANVILLQIEALDSTILFRSHNGIEIIPNINRLVKQNCYYDRYFAQHNTGTVDADYSLITSNYAGAHYTAFTFCDMTGFTSLPRALKKHGYYTSAMHANRGTFYNRETAFRELGFDDFFSREDFPEPEKGAWALYDFTFLEHSAARLGEHSQPFFSYIITISSHTPFDFHPREKDPPEFQDLTPPLVKNYFSSMHFVDSAVGRFMEILGQKGLLKNTIIVLLSDHSSKISKETYSALDYLEEKVSEIGEYPEHVPLVLIYPENISRRISKYCFPGDVAPAVMDFLGFHDDPTPWLGFSLFSKASSPVIVQGRQIIVLRDGYLYRGSPGNFSVWKKTAWGDTEPTLLSREYTDYLSGLVKYSNDILLKNYR